MSLTTGFVVVLRPGCDDVGSVRAALSMIRGVERVEDLEQVFDHEGGEPAPASLPSNSLLKLLELDLAELGPGSGPCVL